MDATIVYSKSKYLSGSAQKARLVLDLIKGKNVEEAVAILMNTNKRAAGQALKTLNTAIANAENNFDMDRDSLVVVEARADESKTFKRGRIVSRGRTHKILKRTCHMIVGVKEVN